MGNGAPISCCSQEFLSLINEACVQGVKSNVTQMPTKDNGHMAMVQADTTTKIGTFTGHGIATPSLINGSTDTQALLDRAYMEAFTRSVAISSLASEQRHDEIVIEPQTVPSPHQSLPAPYQREQGQKTEYHHSRKKPISDAQRHLIERLANEKHIDLQDFIYQRYNKTIDQLSSFDANDAISFLTSQPSR